MFSEAISTSNIIEVINEEPSDTSVKIMLRVKDKKRWAKMMQRMLLDNLEVDNYGVAVNKSYWVVEDTKQLSFCWVLIIWGNLEEALADLTPELSKKSGPKKPPPGINPIITGKDSGMATILDRRTSGMDEGVRKSATVIKLPHRSAVRNNKINKTKKVGDNKRGRYAYAESIGEGNPW